MYRNVQVFIASKIEKSKPYWTGANDRMTDGNWVWSDDTPVDNDVMWVHASFTKIKA
ncbi:MAG: hypothetical protein GY696_20480 [Gammaproteobacteria bacterium]|nr:hypothetical protein [Gammaproteobacteria bacterium]